LQGKEMNTALTLVTGEQWKRIRWVNIFLKRLDLFKSSL